jgi:hypothetical protein
MGTLTDGSTCIKSPSWDVLPDCEAKFAEWKAAAGECGSPEGTLKPGCQETLLALDQSFDWGAAICKEVALAKMLASGDAQMQAAMEAGLSQLYAMPNCEGKVRPSPAEIEEIEDGTKKDATTMYLALAIGAVGIGSLIGIGVLMMRK